MTFKFDQTFLETTLEVTLVKYTTFSEDLVNDQLRHQIAIMWSNFMKQRQPYSTWSRFILIERFSETHF